MPKSSVSPSQQKAALIAEALRLATEALALDGPADPGCVRDLLIEAEALEMRLKRRQIAIRAAESQE